MEISFPRYLLSKRTVDDRALHAGVYRRLRACLPAGRPLRIVEAGAGIGTMVARLLEWGLLERAEYTAVDESSESIGYAREWMPRWALAAGLSVEETLGGLRLYDATRDVQVRLLACDLFDYIRTRPDPAGLLVAHAFLDLLPLPASLPGLLSLLEPGGLAWLTLNYDSATLFEPETDPPFEAQVMALYHRTMDERITRGQPSGDSRTGRRLFGYLSHAGAEILEAGASDWTVFSRAGQYPADEAYFLQCILHFVEGSLAGRPDLDQGRFAQWLAERRAQIERGELVYIAHQMDFLARVSA